MNKAPSPFWVYAAAVLGIFIWGGSPAATKLAVQELDGFSVAILRTVLAAFLIAPFAFAKRFPLPQSKTHWATLAAASLIGIILYSILFSIGLGMTSTIHAALIIASAPLFTGFIGFFIEKSWPRPIWWGGAAIALTGEAFLVFSKPEGSAGDATLMGDFLVLLSIMCVSVGYVAGARLSRPLGTWPATAWSTVIAGICLLPLFFPIIGQTDWTTITPLGWGALFYLVVFIVIVGYACWYWAIGQLGVGAVAPLQFAQPIVSMVLGVLIFSEEITLQIIVASVAILIGIAITKRA